MAARQFGQAHCNANSKVRQRGLTKILSNCSLFSKKICLQENLASLKDRPATLEIGEISLTLQFKTNRPHKTNFIFSHPEKTG
jgi:hypothetical protein